MSLGEVKSTLTETNELVLSWPEVWLSICDYYCIRPNFDDSDSDSIRISEVDIDPETKQTSEQSLSIRVRDMTDTKGVRIVAQDVE